MPEERLQKILSRAGVASRRHAEQLILEGRVTVNGQVVSQLGSKADPDRDHIKVDGRLIRRSERLVYLALHKPGSCVTTASDPQGRHTVLDLVRGVKDRVYPVGRLDYHSEGLLLLTNDGDFANGLMSKANRIAKTYLVKVNGMLSPDEEERFRRGVPLMGRATAPAMLKLVLRAVKPWYEVRLIEGRNQQVRLMFKHFGKLVEKLKRVKIGPLDLGSLKPGAWRHLSLGEVEQLKRMMKHGNRHGSNR